MSVSPNNSKRDVEGAKEEEWEVVSGSKSLSLDTAVKSENTENEKKETSLLQNENEEKENKPIEVTELKAEEAAEKEPEDWYQVIPVTPLNTPEYTPVPPPYPSFNKKTENQKGPDGPELTPIREEIAEEQNQNPAAPEAGITSSEEDNEEGIEITNLGFLKQSLDIINYGIGRVALFIFVFGIVKWLFTKACEKIRNIKARPKTKQAVG